MWANRRRAVFALDWMMVHDERRRAIQDALDRLSPANRQRIQRELERAETPSFRPVAGLAGYVVRDVVIPTDGGNAAVLAKVAYLADADDVWRYGLFDPEACRPQGIPRGEAFMTSARTWKGPHDPDVPADK
jgi:hypothetical protein